MERKKLRSCFTWQVWINFNKRQNIQWIAMDSGGWLELNGTKVTAKSVPIF